MTQNVEETIEEVPAPDAPTPMQLTLLESWRGLLSSIEDVRDQRIVPADASRILRNWPHLKTQELNAYNGDFLDRMVQIRDILNVEIELEPEALGRGGADDGVDNAHHYLNLLLQWQLLIQTWTEAWDCDSADSHITLASIAEVQKFLFGPEGMCKHLDSIGFVFTEEDGAMLQDELLAAKEA